jgi:transposase
MTEFVVKTFYPSSDSCVAVERHYNRNVFVRIAPSRDTAYQIIKQCEETGNVCHKRAKGRNRCASVRTDEVVGAARRK